MPILNGDATGSSAPLLSERPLEDYTKALEILDKNYGDADGLSVHDLLDSKKHGALTYNDFLVLPGYIGTCSVCLMHEIVLTAHSRLPCFICHT